MGTFLFLELAVPLLEEKGCTGDSIEVEFIPPAPQTLHLHPTGSTPSGHLSNPNTDSPSSFIQLGTHPQQLQNLVRQFQIEARKASSHRSREIQAFFQNDLIHPKKEIVELLMFWIL